MNDLERRLGQLVGPIDRPDVAGLERRASERRTARHRRIGSLAAVLVVVAGVVGVAAWQIGRDDGPVLTEVGTTDPTPTTEPSEGDAPIRYPVLDDDRCRTTRPWDVEGSEDSQPYTGQPFAIPNSAYSSVNRSSAAQAFDQDGSAPDAFLVALRVPWGLDSSTFRQTIAGRPVRIVASENGVGEVVVDLQDGTWLYVRSRGLPRDALERFLADLDPRPADASIPGIDLAEDSSFDLIDEAADLGWSDVSTSTCIRDDVATSSTVGPMIYTTVLSGRLVDVYGTALDWRPPTTIREQSDGSLLLLWGASALIDESMLDDVIDVGPREWADLPTTPSAWPCTGCNPPDLG